MFELLKKLITSRDLEGLFSFCSNLAEEIMKKEGIR